MKSYRSRSASSCVVSASYLRKHSRDLSEKPADLSVEDLREIGRHIGCALRDEGLHAEGLKAAALFNATCSTRPDKEQEALLGVQDKVLAGLRAVSSSLTTDLHRAVRAALLPLVAQPGFSKKRKGYRQHLVQALAEAASGPLPPSALLPILRAKETGPGATDLTLEVLERVTGEEDNGASNGTSKKAVIDLLHRVVAEVVTSGTTIAGKTAAKTKKGPPAHLVSFLVQACSTLADYVLVFAKDLLALAESRSSSARKLSLAVLVAVLERCRGKAGRGATADPALAAVLRFARSDGDATVRCSAFDSVAGYVGQLKTSYSDRRDGSSSSDLESDTEGDVAARRRSETPSEDAGAAETGGGGGGGGGGRGRGGDSELEHRGRATDMPPRDGVKPDHANGEGETPGSRSGRTPTTSPREEPAGRANSRGHGAEEGTTATATTSTSAQDPSGRASPGQGEKGGALGDPWGEGGALLLSLSASADALSADGSKAVRAKALACSFRILEVHGGAGCLGSGEGSEVSGSVRRALSKAAKGAWGALEAVASDGGGFAGHAASAGGGRHRKAADAARDLLTLACVDANPVDLVSCYQRCCRLAPGAGAGAAVGTAEAKRALRDVAQSRFCADIETLLRAVYAVKAEDERGEAGEDRDETKSSSSCFGDADDDAGFSLSDVLCEVLAGVDAEVIGSLLRDALEAYAAGDDNHRPNDGAATSAPVILRTLALLAEADGDHAGISTTATAATPSSSSSSDKNRQLRVLAGSQPLFWRRLERRMEEIEQEEDGEAEGGGRGAGGGGGLGQRAPAPPVVSEAVSELSELLRVFRLLASRSLVSPENSAALEALVFPAALSRRRLIRPAVGLALALDEPHRVLLSSLAVLQDAAFARSSTHVGRACDYVRLVGVLARENASFVAAHVRERYACAVKGRNVGRDALREEGEGGRGGEDEHEDHYMAEASNREAMEREIRRLRDASVTSDGMLSCYTPFLLAIVKRRVANAAAAARAPPLLPSNEEDALLPGSAAAASGSSSGLSAGVGDRHGSRISSTAAVSEAGGTGAAAADEERGKRPGDGGAVPLSSPPLSCPRALCAEALWALSEYAVLSPGLAAAEVLPLAEGLAGDTREHAQIRSAAVAVLTRRELATDEIAAHACCNLLEDEDPSLRREVLARLGRLMKESRIKTAHLSRFALLLVDGCEGVRSTARAVFFDHLQPRPDTVARCLFETFFTLDAEDSVKRRVLENLIAVAHKAAPSQGLQSLGGALVRKATETGDSQAAFFLSLVPPTVNSLEAAEVALRRGHLAQAPTETVSLVAAHFCKAARRGGGSPSLSSSSSSAAVTGNGSKTTTTAAAPSKAQALEMAARIGSLARTSSHRKPPGEQEVGVSARSRTRRGQVATQSGGGAGSPPPAVEHGAGNAGSGEARRGARKSAIRKSGSRASKKRRRVRNDGGSSHGGGGGRSRATGKEKGKGKSESVDDGMSVEEKEEEEEEEEEEEWEG